MMICFAPGYKKIQIYTIDPKLNNKLTILKSVIINSFELMPKITEVLDELIINKRDLSSIGVYEGPSPLTTTRGILSIVKALSYALNLPIFSLGGAKYYREEENKYTVLLQAFGGFAYKYNSTTEVESYSLLSDIFHNYNYEVIILDESLNQTLIQESNLSNLRIIIKELPNVNLINIDLSKKYKIHNFTKEEDLAPYSKNAFQD